MNLVDVTRHGRTPLQGSPGIHAEVAASSAMVRGWPGPGVNPNWSTFTLHDPESGKLGVTSSLDVSDTWDLDESELACVSGLAAGEDGLKAAVQGTHRPA